MKWSMNKSVHILLPAVLMLATIGCQYLGLSTKEDEVADGVRKPAPPLVMLIENPRVLREDVIYPADSVKQSLLWQNQYAEWRFNLPVKGYAYAGFRFFKPYNLSLHIESYELIFSITPASKSRYLWVGLVDGDDQPGNMLIELPIKEFAKTQRGGGSTVVKIPLSMFPSSGIPAQLDSGLEDSLSAPFDWQDVREIRLINPGGRLPPGDVVITEIRFER